MAALIRFRGTRNIVTYEVVEVLAKNYDEARELIEDNDESVHILSEREADYEIIGHLIEI